MKNITLQINGREITFSEQQIVDIVQKYLHEEIRPIEGKYFEVDPFSIDRKLFLNDRKDSKQESARQLINQAFLQLDKYPERYGKKFYTLMPECTWNCGKSTKEIYDIALELGDHIANWVEQALEWAQRITNGETWEALCNDDDTAKWHRLIEWKKEGYLIMVGGATTSYIPSIPSHGHCPATEVFVFNEHDAGHPISCPYGAWSKTIPLVVTYDV